MLYRILEVEINMLKLSHIKKGYNKKEKKFAYWSYSK